MKTRTFRRRAKGIVATWQTAKISNPAARLVDELKSRPYRVLRNLCVGLFGQKHRTFTLIRNLSQFDDDMTCKT